MSAWDCSVPDWGDRILAGRSLLPELPLYAAEREKAIRIFNRLKLPDVIGTPTMADAAGEWFREIVGVLFGSYDSLANVRRVQEYFLLVPKKNAKSSYSAAIMLVAMIRNRRPNAEYLLIAPTKKIADIAFKQASDTIRLDPELDKLFHRQSHIRTITHRVSGAILAIKAADTDVITGSKSTGILVDETHEFAKKPHAAEVFVEIRGALAARPDGFMLQITTQSKEPPVGLFKAELALARDVRDGLVQLPRLAVLYELPAKIVENGGWKSERTWPLVNPNLGRSVSESWLRDELVAAEHKGIEQLALLASQHFNVELGQNLRADRWAGAEFWERQAWPGGLTLEDVIERSDVIVPGIDGGGLDDLFGLAVLGRDAETRNWLLWTHCWCHTSVLERRKSIASRLLDAKASGELTIVGDALDDVAEIVETIAAIRASGKLAHVAVDPAGLGEFVDALAAIGITEDSGELVGAKQGYALMNAIKTAERKLANGTLWHSGSALMSWCVGNLKIEPTATAIRATKQNAGDAKIDPTMALFDAVTFMVLNPEPAGGGPSVYEERGPRFA